MNTALPTPTAQSPAAHSSNANPLITRADLRLAPVTFELYREIHKGIRRQLFELTMAVGSADPSVADERRDLAARVKETALVLEQHAVHEDDAIQPSVELYLPELAAQVEHDHHVFERRVYGLVTLADEAWTATTGQRQLLHELYLGLAAFTSSYLAHQDLEERQIMPALERAVGIEAVIGMHTAIITSIAPADMAKALTMMLPAMNVEDRVEMYAGMKAGAPAEAFNALVSLADVVIGSKETRRLLERLPA